MVTLASKSSFGSALLNIAKNSSKLQSISQKLSTGKKVNNARDNPVALQQIASFSADIRGINVANFNVNNASSVLNTAEGGLSNISNTLGQLRDLAVQASSDLLTPTQRSAIGDQANSLLGSLNQIAGNLNFNGTNLLDGSFGSKSIQVGPNAGDTVNVSLDSANATALGVDAIDLSNSANASSSITTLEAALTQVQSQRASVGSSIQSLENTYNANNTVLENLTAARSTVEDLDFGEATATLFKLQIQQKAQSLVLGQSLNTEKSKLSILV